ncbi:MAG: hypothetical protein WC530_07305 [Candidatus Omnitrophota bacterium]
MFLANNTQKLAVRILESHIREKRVASSYIFSGCGEEGEMAEMDGERHSADLKEEFAVAFAYALESGDPKLFHYKDSVLLQRIWKHGYPDVRWLGEDLTERSIKIETIRETIQWASMKPFEGTWKICIVLKAERLQEVAANAFLKTLEEPPKNTVFCLLTENKNNLLETIQSRSFEIRLMPMLSSPVPMGVGSLEALPVREVFEAFPAMPRDEVKRKLDGLMTLSREKIYQLVSGRDADPRAVNRWLEAMDLLYDSKSALDMNVNQKLMATRLAIRLARLFPSQKVVSL